MNDVDRPARDRARTGRTGAGTASPRPKPAPKPPVGQRGAGGGRAATTHRGVRWERNTAGRLRWHDDDGDRWVLWKPGQDAPPLPPQWATQAETVGTPLRDRRARAGWRSPYRLAPVILIVGVTIIAIVQATRGHAPSPSPAAIEKAAAEKLLDKCLVTQGSRIESQPVPCNSPRASVKVVKVLPGTPGSPSCPTGTTTVRLAYPGVAHPHQLCVEHLGA